ncbi:MAG: hypothetical protein QOJ99_4073 [Bryobacterales bacterium]|nr:hypothetical protein [Bryobacterales bacterium]
MTPRTAATLRCSAGRLKAGTRYWLGDVRQRHVARVGLGVQVPAQRRASVRNQESLIWLDSALIPRALSPWRTTPERGVSRLTRSGMLERLADAIVTRVAWSTLSPATLPMKAKGFDMALKVYLLEALMVTQMTTLIHGLPTTEKQRVPDRLDRPRPRLNFSTLGYQRIELRLLRR